MIKVLAAALALSFAPVAHAAEFSVSPTGDALAMVGNIYPGDTSKLVMIHALSTGKHGKSPRMIFLHSDGGLTGESLHLAEMVKRLGLATVVGADSSCYSMCVTIFAAGNVRVISRSGELGVHAMSEFVDGQFVETDKSRIVMDHVARVMADYGTPEIVISKMFTTPSTDINILDVKDISEWVEIID